MTTENGGQGPMQLYNAWDWLALIVIAVFFIYCEAFRGFHKGFAPCLVRRCFEYSALYYGDLDDYVRSPKAIENGKDGEATHDFVLAADKDKVNMAAEGEQSPNHDYGAVSNKTLDASKKATDSGTDVLTDDSKKNTSTEREAPPTLVWTRMLGKNQNACVFYLFMFLDFLKK